MAESRWYSTICLTFFIGCLFQGLLRTEYMLDDSIRLGANVQKTFGVVGDAAEIEIAADAVSSGRFGVMVYADSDKKWFRDCNQPGEQAGHFRRNVIPR